jgi:hypothetical protein
MVVAGVTGRKQGIMTIRRRVALLAGVLVASLSIAAFSAPSKAQATITSALTVLRASTNLKNSSDLGG